MGRKINPIAFRLAVRKDWRSKWYASGADYTTKLHEDLAVRRYLEKQLANASLSNVTIERAWNSVRVTLSTSRPGFIIGRKGEAIERMTEAVSKLCNGSPVKIEINEVRKPELDAQIVSQQVASQLERRINFRRAMKRSVQTAMDFGADGIRIRVSGRLGGADIARAEWYTEGKVPLQTLRAPIDYGFSEASTVYGIIGVKVWINKKEELPQKGGNERRGGSRNRRPNNRNRGPKPAQS